MKDFSADCQQAYSIVSLIIQRLGLREKSQVSYPTGDIAMQQSIEARQYSTEDQLMRSIAASGAENPGDTSAQTSESSNQDPPTLPDQFSPSTFDFSSIESFFDDPHSADWVRIHCGSTYRVAC